MELGLVNAQRIQQYFFGSSTWYDDTLADGFLKHVQVNITSEKTSLELNYLMGREINTNNFNLT